MDISYLFKDVHIRYGILYSVKSSNESPAFQKSRRRRPFPEKTTGKPLLSRQTTEAFPAPDFGGIRPPLRRRPRALGSNPTLFYANKLFPFPAHDGETLCYRAASALTPAFPPQKSTFEQSLKRAKRRSVRSNASCSFPVCRTPGSSHMFLTRSVSSF